MTLPAYRIGETYDWNYEHAPSPPRDLRTPACPGTWDFGGMTIGSPLGVPAGPLLNSRWILYYAALGFDVLTYKTVRSVARPSYALPNLLPVESEPIAGTTSVTAAAGPDRWDSWATISFGMPSKEPRKWQEDVEAARHALPIASASDAVERLAAGAHHLQIATAAMLNPEIGIDIRDALARRPAVAAV